ncbi:MAG TPA: hypothetical protein VKY85_08385 [Candidatus Angelobacter sp.]|nr:hypothetical protein [Candidatus Angelobacter sp.]
MKSLRIAALPLMKKAKMRRAPSLLITAAVVVLFFPIRAVGQFRLPGVPIPNRDTIQQKLLERALRAVLDNQLPVKLDAKSVYRTTAKLPGGPFVPQPLQLTADNLRSPLPPGDYTINVLAFCTEYSAHRPGQGVAYELAPLQGKAAGAVANLLWRGTFQGMTPQHLLAVSWAIQSGLTYSRMPKSFQDTIDKLIPDYKHQLQGDLVQNIEDTYQRYAQGFQLPPLDLLLQEKMGKAGQLLLSAKRLRDILLQQNASDEIKEQTLFAGQESGVYTPVRAEEGPWTVMIPDVAYIRYKIVGGHLANNNIIEIRILRQPGKTSSISPGPRFVNSRYEGTGAASSPEEQTSPLALMGVAGSAQTALNASGMIGYSQGQAAQALIPVIPMPGTSPNNPDCSKQVQVVSFAACAHCPAGAGSSRLSLPGPQLSQNVKGNTLSLLTNAEALLLFPVAGIKFYADIHINDGAIPIDRIHVRYVNNLVAYNGSQIYNYSPNETASLTGGATLPVLDSSEQWFPYYGGIPEQPSSGADRTLEANDSPNLSALIVRDDPARQLENINIVKGFTMYLGCTTNQADPTNFRTLATLDWTAVFSGTVMSYSPFTFRVSDTSGIIIRPSQPSQAVPLMKGPIANGHTGLAP